MSIDTTSTPFRFLPMDYLGVDAEGRHQFRNELGVVGMEPAYLDYILAHPKLGPAHAEAMERAKA